MVGKDEAVAWVALRGVAGVGDAGARRLLACFGGVQAVLDAPPAAVEAAGFSSAVARALASADRRAAAEEIRRADAAGARLIPLDDPEYPPLLAQVADAPLYLVARGEALAEGPSVAVVGARRATPYGREVATRLAEELAQAGVAVVSGLARGIDAAAHHGALRGGGSTVAVLGSGIDVIYPAEHEELATRIAETGTLLSERPLGTPPLPENFPARNRIIAGMAHGTVVVEAAERSGSLITARLALEQGREVFAVPGRIDSALSIGAHRLIQQGAKLVTSVDDVLQEIAPALQARAAGSRRPAPGRGGDAADDGESGEALVPLLAAGPLAIDQLIVESGLPASQVLARVLALELAGVLVQIPGKQFQLAKR